MEADRYGDPTPWLNKCPWLNIFFWLENRIYSLPCFEVRRCIILLSSTCSPAVAVPLVESPHEVEFGRIVDLKVEGFVKQISERTRFDI